MFKILSKEFHRAVICSVSLKYIKNMQSLQYCKLFKFFDIRPISYFPPFERRKVFVEVSDIS